MIRRDNDFIRIDIAELKLWLPMAIEYFAFAMVFTVLVWGVVAVFSKPHENTATVKHSAPDVVSHNQEVVLEHSNHPDDTGNSIVVYCDLPSYDRLYVLNNSTITVVKGGCANLP